MKKMLTILVSLIFAMYTLMALFVLQPRINEGTARQQELERMIQTQKVVNAALREDIGFEAGGEEADARIARIARERIGLVEPGEVIFVNRTP